MCEDRCQLLRDLAYWRGWLAPLRNDPEGSRPTKVGYESLIAVLHRAESFIAAEAEADV